jgi:hypothetical protein
VVGCVFLGFFGIWRVRIGKLMNGIGWNPAKVQIGSLSLSDLMEAASVHVQIYMGIYMGIYLFIQWLNMESIVQLMQIHLLRRKKYSTYAVMIDPVKP